MAFYGSHFVLNVDSVFSDTGSLTSEVESIDAMYCLGFTANKVITDAFEYVNDGSVIKHAGVLARAKASCSGGVQRVNVPAAADYPNEPNFLSPPVNPPRNIWPPPNFNI